MTSLGEKRYESDMRQFGGLLMTFGVLITMNSLTTTTAVVNGGMTPRSGAPLFDLIASLCLTLVGFFGVIMGYAVLVQDRGWTMFSLINCVVTQLAWLPFLGGMVGVGMASRTGDKFLGAMGIISIIAYASAFVGSLSFMQFAIYFYQSGKMKMYNASYYRGRLCYYSFMLALAGFAQMSVGSYVLNKVGNGPLVEPVMAGPVMVVFPEISVFIGIVQLLVGFLGIARVFGLTLGIVHTYQFSWLCILVWVIMLSMQILVQLGYPGDAMVAMAPTMGCMLFATPFMPAYLDHKMTTVPEEIEDGYYEVHVAAEKEDIQVVEEAVEEKGEKEEKAEQAV